ncbi:MAG: tryptophan synthase subunit alpha [Cyclobacteriaceae bacterium]|nr:tryptophan synthase subunit alpha [Cyclobacteriaceae bacterium]
MSRLKKLFQEKKQNVLSVFYTAGFPKRDDTVSIARHLQAAGADIIEIGIPFSDPVADGPTIQASNKIALDNGMTVKLLLEQVKEIRKSVTMPVVLMGYLNPVLQYGFEKFCNDAAAAGVDGLILPDMPLDEFNEHRALTTSLGLDVIFLISPTTSPERIAVIDGLSSGFVYAVSSSSTTGAKKGFTSEQEEYFRKLKNAGLKNPFLIGFGISDHQTFSKASQFSSGAIVGSAFINLLKESNNFESDIAQFVRSLKA